MSVTGYPFDGYDGTDQSFERLQDAGRRRGVTEPCPNCGVPMIIEDGLWHCEGCDAYHGEVIADSQCGYPAPHGPHEMFGGFGCDGNLTGNSACDAARAIREQCPEPEQ